MGGEFYADAACKVTLYQLAPPDTHATETEVHTVSGQQSALESQRRGQ